MPRIDDSFLNCCVFLYPSRPDAEGGMPHGGSGFLVSVPPKKPTFDGRRIPLYPRGSRERYSAAGEVDHNDYYNSYHHLYIVTNRHLIDNGNFARLTGKNKQQAIVEIGEWHLHGTSDLAVAPIAWSRTRPWERGFAYSVVPYDLFLTQGLMRHMDVGPGDDAFCVGRFIGHDGKEKNLPIVRFGHISMLPLEPVEIEGEGPQNCFLVESRIIPGYSGSPMFLSIPPWELKEFGGQRGWVAEEIQETIDEYGKDKPSYYVRLLGVTAGLFKNDLLIGKNAKEEKEVIKDINTGMTIVIPAWELLDLLNRGDLEKQREAEEERRKSERKSGATPA